MMKLTIICVAIAMLLAVTCAQEEQLLNKGLDQCHCISTLEYLPICASNGVSYSNKRMMECAQECLGLRDIRKVHDGAC